MQALIKKVSPSVVQILVTGFGAVEETEHGNTGLVIGRQRAIGSGFVIDANGHIMTNAHVVKGAENIHVVLPSATGDTSARSALAARGTVVPARVVGVARDLDLALLKVEAEHLQKLGLAPYRELQQGELVFAFGSPEGLRNSVTMGVVSATAWQLDPGLALVYVQTDAASKVRPHAPERDRNKPPDHHTDAGSRTEAAAEYRRDYFRCASG